MNADTPRNESYCPDASRYPLVVVEGTRRRDLTFADLFPRQLCPYLAHTLIPYMLAFQNGGRFPWMERISPDAVDAQCPNPSGAVTARLRETEDGFGAKIMAVRGNCPFGYKEGDDLEWLAPERAPLEDLNLLLSWMLRLHSMESDSGTLSVASPSDSDVSYRVEGKKKHRVPACPPGVDFILQLGRFTHRCRYHKWPRREEYDRRNWIPEGLCPELFHAAYPSCLALIYSEKPGISRPLYCPEGARVQVLITTEDRRATPLRKAAMKVFHIAGKNIEIPFRRCRIHVMRAGDCPIGMSRGTSFEFNMGGLPQLCPAFFHNSYPVLAALMRGAKPPWRGLEDNGGLVQCPDCLSNITMAYGAER